MTSADSTSTKKVDHLNVDTPVPGQNFVCLSFVSPEKILQDKSKFFMNAFWTYLKQNGTSDEAARFDLAMLDNINDVYDTFLHEKQQELEDAFHKENDLHTTVRGLKVRGVYNTMEEARVRSKVLQRLDKSHHVFVAPVGYWLPWDPNADQIEDQEYQEDQLNDLMKKYKENEIKRDIYYEDEKTKLKEQAIKENMARKEANRTEAQRDGDSPVIDDGPTADDIGQSLDDAKSHTDLASDFAKFKNKSD
jgi:hypothetical protein